MANALFDCTGKVTLVTGGNGGLGLGFAMGCAKMGSDIVIWARNAEKSAVAREQLLEAGAGRVEACEVDVSSEEQVIEGYRKLKADFGRLDCVFANSGRSSKSASFLTMDSAEWHDLLNVSLHGAFYTLREGAKLMVERAETGEPERFAGLLRQPVDVPGPQGHGQLRGGQGRDGRGDPVDGG